MDDVSRFTIKRTVFFRSISFIALYFCLPPMHAIGSLNCLLFCSFQRWLLTSRFLLLASRFFIFIFVYRLWSLISHLSKLVARRSPLASLLSLLPLASRLSLSPSFSFNFYVSGWLQQYFSNDFVIYKCVCFIYTWSKESYNNEWKKTKQKKKAQTRVHCIKIVDSIRIVYVQNTINPTSCFVLCYYCVWFEVKLKRRALERDKRRTTTRNDIFYVCVKR